MPRSHRPVVIRTVIVALAPFGVPYMLISIIAVATTLLTAHLVYTLVEQHFINLGWVLRKKTAKAPLLSGA